MAAIVSIVAKVMLITDALLEKFVTVGWAYTDLGEAYCNIGAINGELTACGSALVDQLVTLIYYAVQLGGQLLPALGAVNGPLSL